MMKKLPIIKSFVMLLFVLSLMVTVTYAWIVYYADMDGAQLPAGQIDYQYDGEFIDSSQIVYPELNLLNQPISVDNLSTIDTQLRLVITYTLIEEESIDKVYHNDIDDDLNVVFDDLFVLSGDYWYYQAYDYRVIEQGVIPLISSVAYDGNQSSIEYANQPIHVEIIIQVKQADHVSWIDLTQYDFNTGSPL